MIPIQYAHAEMMRFNHELRAIKLSPLADRKEGLDEYKKLVTSDLKHFEFLIDLVLNGSFGAEIYYSFAYLSARSNRNAWLFNHLAAVEYRTEPRMAAGLWNKLDTDLQHAINRILSEAIAEFDKTRDEKGL